MRFVIVFKRIFHAPPPLISRKLSFFSLLEDRSWFVFCSYFFFYQGRILDVLRDFFKWSSFFKPRSKPLSLNKRGLSLVGVLVASSLSVVVVTGVTKISTHLARVSKRASLQFEMIDIVNEIRTHLREETSCVKTFQNVKIQGQTLLPVSSPSPLISSLFDKEGSIVYKKDCYERGVDETPCRRGNIKFVEFKPLPPQEDTLPFLIDLMVFLGHREGGRVTQTRSYPIKVLISELDATSKKVRRCKALGGREEEALRDCDPLREGAVLFEAGDLKYCDGNGWRTPASPPSKIGNCRGIPYHSEFEKCCWSQRTVKRKSESCTSPTTSYCKGVAYNSESHRCCTESGRVVLAGESCSTLPSDSLDSFVKNCGSQKYFSKTQKCCGGSVGVRQIGESCTVVSTAPPPPPTPTPPLSTIRRCRGFAYDPRTHKCCASFGCSRGPMKFVVRKGTSCFCSRK